jgi:peptidoglycan/LPS O-acetylase OafA/YrhL
VDHSIKYIKGFDGLRAISIIMVLLSHLGLFTFFLLDLKESPLPQLISGTNGVMFFFAISGFLITHLLLLEKKANGKVSLFNFFARRILRLAPPLLVFYCVIAILMVTGVISISSWAFIISFFYLYNFVPDKFNSGFLSHTWSLAVEEQFYLFWPFVVNFYNARKTAAIAVVILVLCVIAVWIYPSITFSLHGRDYTLEEYFYPMRFLFPAMAPIMCGAIISVLNYKGFFDLFRSDILLLFIAVMLYVLPSFLPSGLHAYLSFFQSAGVSLLLVYIYRNQTSVLTRVLEYPSFAFIGKISYGIYIWQGLFLKTGPGGSLWINQFPVNLLLTFAVALLSYYIVEKPALKLKSRFK